MRLLFAAMIALAPTAATAQQGIFTPFRPQIVGQGHPSSPSYGGYAYRSYRHTSEVDMWHQGITEVRSAASMTIPVE